MHAPVFLRTRELGGQKWQHRWGWRAPPLYTLQHRHEKCSPKVLAVCIFKLWVILTVISSNFLTQKRVILLLRFVQSHPFPSFSFGCLSSVLPIYFQFLCMKVKHFFAKRTDAQTITTDQFQFHLVSVFNKLLIKLKPVTCKIHSSMVQSKTSRMIPCQENY